MNNIKHISRLNFKKLVFFKRYLETSAQCLSSASRKFNVQTDCSFENKNKPRIVIIGAGIAGLSAAARLINAGFDNLIVLEATERPGGRIYSCWLGNTVAEIGAQWITGSSLSNPIIPLASQAGLLDEQHEYNYRTGTYVTTNGRPLDRHLSSHAYLTFKQLVKQAYSLFSITPSQRHGSLMNFFTLRIEQELNNFPVNQRKDAASIMYGLTNKISNRWGAELENISADLFGTYIPLIGKTISLPIGFVSVLSPLLNEIPHGVIRYSKNVEKIQWQCVPNARVSVQTNDLCSFNADYVIITVSLGVLKHLADVMFVPKLPREKRKAIDRMGYGNISKLFMEYCKPFWIPKQGPIKFAWSPEEMNKRDSWMKGLHCLEEVPGCRYILMGTVSGCYADELEELTDIEIAENMTALLRRFTQDPTIPYPNSMLRSKWKCSPFFYGATSFMSMDSTPAIQRNLTKPIPYSLCGKPDETAGVIPKLFFAGEATSPNFYSTVHGARQSGLRAADEIIELTNKIGGLPPLTDKNPVEEEDEDDQCD